MSNKNMDPNEPRGIVCFFFAVLAIGCIYCALSCYKDACKSEQRFEAYVKGTVIQKRTDTYVETFYYGKNHPWGRKHTDTEVYKYFMTVKPTDQKLYKTFTVEVDPVTYRNHSVNDSISLYMNKKFCERNYTEPTGWEPFKPLLYLFGSAASGISALIFILVFLVVLIKPENIESI